MSINIFQILPKGGYNVPLIDSLTRLITKEITISSLSATTRRCYQCFSSDTERCRTTQTEEDCPNTGHVCMTITYSRLNNGPSKKETNHVFQKQCISPARCRIQCRALKVIGVIDCKVTHLSVLT